MEERTQVYAFEQDQESEGGVKHEDGAINQFDLVILIDLVMSGGS